MKDANDLHDQLGRLDPQDVRTALTVVVTSYTTWFRRTTHRVQPSEPVGTHSDDPSEHFEAETDEESMPADWVSDTYVQRLDELQQEQSDNDEDEDDSHTPATKRKVSIKYESHCSIFWGRVVCDEAQKVKAIRTRMHQSIALLKREFLWFLTATPMRNKVLDMCGYLTMLAGSVKLDFVDGMPQGVPMPPGVPLTSDDPWIEWYRRWSAVESLPSLTAGRPYKLLAPASLARLAESGGHLTAQSGYDASPIIFRLCMLQRQMGDIIQDGQRGTLVIGVDTPPVRVMTIELCYSRKSQSFHDRVYTHLVKRLRKQSSEQESADQEGPASSSSHDRGMIDWGVFRRLSLLGFSPKLEIFFQTAGVHETTSEEVRRHIEAKDRGFLCSSLAPHRTALPYSRP